jgi:aspartate kinase
VTSPSRSSIDSKSILPHRLVVKFGGTSMGSFASMVQSATVALERSASVVVVSAMSGVTNRLIEMTAFAQAADAVAVQSALAELREKHGLAYQPLQLSRAELAPVDALFSELAALLEGIRLLGECSPRAYDAVISMGERLSSRVFEFVLAAEARKKKSTLSIRWFDVRDVMTTDERFGQATPLLDSLTKNTARHLLPLLDLNIVVTQGFIGRSASGATTTLGRGGSDYSASLLAEALDSSAVEIWTDVPGIATTDPRIVAHARIIPEISFDEAAEAATFGAKVLHPATVLPAMRKQIPVFVASTFEPEHHGTWVRAEVPHPPLVRAIALKRKQVLLTLSTPEMMYAHGFLARVFQIFAEFQISVDNITTSQVSIAMTLDDSTLLNPLLFERLSAVAKVTREEGLVLVSVIGNGINHTPGLASRIFKTVVDINVRMIGLGASEHQFCLLVSEENAEEVVRRLHRSLIENQES